MKHYYTYPDWVHCPECGSAEVDTFADYNREIGFACQDCGHEAPPGTAEEYVYEADD